MNIYGKTEIKPTFFKDLKGGEVFYFLKDCKDIKDIKVKIYMRCGHTQSDKSAVNLETGICYGFDDYEPVEVLDATMNIKPKQQ